LGCFIFEMPMDSHMSWPSKIDRRNEEEIWPREV
jgi:hypothetical protein